ncbi:MAG TPA: hypothetical protein VJO16_17425 [Candidatus Acidoferrum sp.]|nr:hypothetical protein [Candidatus Acidoferrum sp.]
MRKLINSVVFLALNLSAAGSLIAQTQPTSQEKDATFQISATLKFKGRVVSGLLRKSDITALLELPVRNGDSNPDQGYGVEMTRDNGERFMAYTCRQWKKALEEKAYSASTFDMAMEGSLIRTCGLLFALQNAKLPLKSFVANPRITLANLDLLPAEILNSEAEEPEKEKEQLRVLTVSKAVARKDFEKVTAKTVTLSYGGFRQSFWEGARADFDGDGVEDILVFTGGRAEGGTLGFTDYFILTRTGPSGPLKVIETKKPWQ